MKYYIAYDGLAAYSVDDAYVVECIGEMKRKQAVKYFNKEWLDHGCRLFEYDIDGENIKNGVDITNG